MNVLSFLLVIGVLVLTVWLIYKTKKEDICFDFDCKGGTNNGSLHYR